MEIAFAILWQIACEHTYAAVAANTPYVIAAARAALQSLRQLATRIKNQPPSA